MSNEHFQPSNNVMNLPLLPLKDIVVFPHMIVPVFINEELCINAVQEALQNDRQIFLSAFHLHGDQEAGLGCNTPAPFDVYDIGTICSVMRTRKLPDGRMKVLVQGIQKAVVKNLTQSDPFPVVEIEKLEIYENEEVDQSEIEASIRLVRDSLEKVVGLGKVLSPDILMILEDVTNPAKLSDLVAANLGLKIQEAQSVLAINDPLVRLKKVHYFLSKELEVYQMQVKIQSQAKEEISKMQREHYLREQIRAIRSELGDSEKDEVEGLWKKLESIEMSETALKETSKQIKRLERMHQESSEASLTRTHIETILSLPWGCNSEDNLDITNVRQTLESDHYGLDKVKDRILEYLAVKKLNAHAKSPIICFVGPPGVGKTSLGKSIAKAMGREFERISLGGVRDEADIRGHRKTYVGAFPGRIISAIKRTGVSNPVIMLDELDKLNSDFRGDPASALLEVLDPEQNKSFTDHYLGVEFDLSKVMFVANANTLSTIPAPLLDRLEIIEISGYSEEEKITISGKYLLPKQIKEKGLSTSCVSFSNDALSTIINDYTRESGLRNLEKQIASVCRKLARQVAEETFSTEDVIVLQPDDIKKNLGARKYEREFLLTAPLPGVSFGLAYTNYGGEVLTIEVNLIPSKSPKLTLTGRLGEVMRESAQAALSYIRSQARNWGIDHQILETNDLHLHVPAGGMPKDGPSAGIAIASAILSILLDQKPKKIVAMTGEITIHGKVLAIGGLREKALAARREGVKNLILPLRNKPDWVELPEYLKQELDVQFVSDYDEVVASLFNITPIVLLPNEQGSLFTDIAS